MEDPATIAEFEAGQLLFFNYIKKMNTMSEDSQRSSGPQKPLPNGMRYLTCPFSVQSAMNKFRLTEALPRCKP
jgi:hypothetical protein